MIALKKFVLLIAILSVMASALIFTGLYFLGDIILNTAFDNFAENSSISQQSQLESYQSGDKPTGNTEDSQQAVEESTAPKTKEDPSATKPKGGTVSDDAGDVYVQADRVEEIKSQVTLNDKLAASKIVLTKLTGEEINYLFGLLSDGLTKAEFEEAKAFALKKFTNAEINEIYSLYSKYFK